MRSVMGVVQISVAEYDPRDGQLERDLCEAFGLKHAIVVRTASKDTPETVRQAVGYFAAPAVSELVHSRVFSVSLVGARCSSWRGT